MLPDLLKGLSRKQRLRRDLDDADYIRRHADIYANAEARKVADMTYAGAGPLKPSDLKPWDESKIADVVVCSRYDLDHPLWYPDNLFCPCTDCGCDLQVRPHAPPGPRVCVCCAARRVAQDIT